MLKPEFIAVLEIIAKATKKMHDEGASEPILVGGAAVEVYTQGAFPSGDFDIAVIRQKEFEGILMSLGFERDSRPHALERGLYHPKYGYGLEVVAEDPMDGNAPRARANRVEGTEGYVNLVSIEDLIADRVSQYESAPNHMQSRLVQAMALYDLANGKGLDQIYLDKRIREETHKLTLDWLKKELHNNAQLQALTRHRPNDRER